MRVQSINWLSFVAFNAEKNIQKQFEELCRQLFLEDFVSKNSKYKYLHNGPNNPGIESEPIFYEKEQIYVGYQAKYFQNAISYAQIDESLSKAIKYYGSKLDRIYLYCNKPINVSAQRYVTMLKKLNDASIELIPISDENLLDSIKKYPRLGIYFGAHNIDHNWLVKQAENAAVL